MHDTRLSVGEMTIIGYDGTVKRKMTSTVVPNDANAANRGGLSESGEAGRVSQGYEKGAIYPIASRNLRFGVCVGDEYGSTRPCNPKGSAAFALHRGLPRCLAPLTPRGSGRMRP